MTNAGYKFTIQDWLLHDEAPGLDYQRLAGWYLARLKATIKAVADQLEIIDPDGSDMLYELSSELTYVNKHYTLKPKQPSKRPNAT